MQRRAAISGQADGETPQERRRELRRRRRLRRKRAPEPVEPREALRRTRRGLICILAAWALVVCVDAVLVRTHVLKDTDTGFATLAGAVAGLLINVVRYGSSGQPDGIVRDGLRLISARTLTGVRTLELDGLVGIRRYSVMGRGSSLDEYRVKDRHGVRLTIGRDSDVDKALRWAVGRAATRPGAPPVAVTRHARSGFGLEPGSSVPQVLHMIWGLLMFMAALGGPAVLSYVAASLLAGTGV